MILKMDPADKTTLDIVAIGTAVGTMANILPHIAAIFTIVWTGIRIYETETFQRMIGRAVKKKEEE